MNRTIQIRTQAHQGLYDITEEVDSILKDSGIKNGLLTVYARGATSAIMIQENWDDSVQNDVINLLNKLIPAGVWEHDRQDNNGDSHLKAGIIGPSETVPVKEGKMLLSTWQNIFFCEFDGPRDIRNTPIKICQKLPLVAAICVHDVQASHLVSLDLVCVSKIRDLPPIWREGRRKIGTVTFGKR